MNQIIVILLLLKNWFRPIKASVFQVIACIVGLLLSLYMYQVYNAIQEQHISVNGISIQSQKIILQSVGLVFDYGDQESTSYSVLFEDLNSGTSVKLSQLLDMDSIKTPQIITADTIIQTIVSRNFDNKIKNSFNSSDNFVYLYTILDYQNNNWLFPRFIFSRDRELAQPEILKDEVTNNSLNIMQVKELSPNLFLSDSISSPIISFNRRTQYFLFENIIAYSDTIIGTGLNIRTPRRFYAPKFYSAYDVSKLEMKISLNVDTLTNFTVSILPLSDVREIYPSPDYKDGRTLIYNNSEKLAILQENGLHLFLTFPKTESLQQTRNYIISAIITLFFTLLATQFYNILKRIVLKHNADRRRILMLLNTRTSHVVKWHRKLIIYNFVWCCIICVSLICIDPYDWTFTQKIGFILLIQAILLSVYRDRLSRFKKSHTIILDNRLNKELTRSKYIVVTLIIAGFITALI